MVAQQALGGRGPGAHKYSRRTAVRGHFLDYWKLYPNNEEAKLTGRTAWSSDALNSDIVAQAAKALVNLLSDGTGEAPSLKAISPDWFRTSGVVVHQSLRFTVFGLRTPAPKIEDSLLSQIRAEGAQSICLVILPHANLQVVDAAESPWTRLPYVSTVLALYPADIDELSWGQVELLQLVEFKLFRRLAGGRSDPETQFDERCFEDYRLTARGSSLSSNAPVITDPTGGVEHPLVSRVLTQAETGASALISGPSSSGKTYLLNQVRERLRRAGKRTRYLSVRDRTIPVRPLEALFVGPKRPQVLVLDDLQSNPNLARYLLGLHTAARLAASDVTLPAIVASTWADFFEEASAWLQGSLLLPVSAFLVHDLIVQRYGSSLRTNITERIEADFGDDLYLLRHTLEKACKESRLPSKEEVAKEIWKNRIQKLRGDGSAAKKVALVTVALGRYDISAPRAFLGAEARTNDAFLNRLEKCGLLRKSGNNLSLGHPSLCALLLYWFESENGWSSFQPRGPRDASNVIMDYLKSQGSGLALDTLRAIQTKVGFKKELTERTSAIVKVWQSLNSLVERIEHQQHLDHTWGKAPASAAFAAETLDEVGEGRRATPSLKYVASLWDIQNNRLVVALEGLSTTNDFRKIRGLMAEQDRDMKRDGPLPWSKASDIEMERFHRTWLMGVFALAEAVTVRSNTATGTGRLDSLVGEIEGSALPSGAFYPERVSWSTSRVLLGLAAAGRTVHNSPVVRKAAHWLLASRKAGGAYDDGIWKSGTGPWNSPVEVTALAVLALTRAGVLSSDNFPGANRTISSATGWLRSAILPSMHQGKYLDAALALQAFLESGGSSDEVTLHLLDLTGWAMQECFWQRATIPADRSLKQTCDVAQAASALVHIAWDAIHRELPGFLKALDLAFPVRAERQLSQVPTGPSHLQVQSDERRKPEEAEQLLRGTEALSFSHFKVAEHYLRFDDGARGKLSRLKEVVEQKLTSRSGLHSYLVWGPSSEGKTSLWEGIGASLSANVRSITVDLSKDSEEAMLAKLAELQNEHRPVLFLVDEVDTRSTETWPYEQLFNRLETIDRKTKSVVFVLIGSTGGNLFGLERHIHGRQKGPDLLTRISPFEKVEVPPLTLGDRMVIFCKNLRDNIVPPQGSDLSVEKLLLLFVLLRPELGTPRALKKCAEAIAENIRRPSRFVTLVDLFGIRDILDYKLLRDFLVAGRSQETEEFENSFIRLSE